MDEYIEKAALYRKISELEKSARDRVIRVPLTNLSLSCSMAILNGYTVMKHMVADFPAADVLPVVRCKSCKHSHFVKSCDKYECRKGCGALKHPTDFCSYGEQKEGDV